MGVIYIFLQTFILSLPIDPFIDYYNHIGWGVGYENGLFPYRDFASNEYPVLSVWGWIAAYNLSPTKSYFWLSVAMNLPYWILAALGGICLYWLLNEYGVEDRAAFGLACLFLFLPINLVDTLNNHGSVGTASTVILAIYLWHREKHLASAAFIAAGCSIKIYPIFVAPFLIWSLQNYQQRVKYSIYFASWIFLFHLPVILILPDYFDTLFWRTTNWGGISYAVLIGITGELFGFDQLATMAWMTGLAFCLIALLYEDGLNTFEKFAIIMMTNNLLEYQGNIMHIIVALPYMAVYFLNETSNLREKQGFWIYLIIGCIWAFDRLMFDLRHISDFTGISYMSFMVLITSILFFVYVRGLTRLGKLQWVLPLDLWNRWHQFRATSEPSQQSPQAPREVTFSAHSRIQNVHPDLKASYSESSLPDHIPSHADLRDYK